MPKTPQQSPAPLRASLDKLLSFAWQTAVFTSADAMAATGLARSTAIDALDELINIGLLHELPNARAAGDYRKGRPSRRFELRADAAVVIGMDAGRSHLTAIVANLRGHAIVTETVKVDMTQDDAETRRSAVLAAVDSALRTAGRTRDSVLAVCVGVPAPVDARGKSPAHHDGFWQRMNPDLREMFEEWVPIVRIENDAGLAALAEGSVGAATDCRDYVVLLAGDRFGAGVVSDGRLMRGAHGGAGEMVALDKVVGVESADGIGLRLTRWAREAVSSGEIPQGHPLAGLPVEQVTGRTVLELARAGDAWAQTITERAGALLARITAVFGSMYDPSRVIIAGAVAESLDQVAEVARTLLPGEVDLAVPDLVLSSLGAGAVAAGAVSTAVDSAQAGVLQLRIAGPGLFGAGADS